MASYDVASNIWQALLRATVVCTNSHVMVGAVQVDPMKPMLKVPGSERLKQRSDDLLSDFASDSN